MFYEPGKTDHGLPFDPFKACVIPRPIGWISTVSPDPNLHPNSNASLRPSSTTTIDNENTLSSSSSIPQGTSNLAPYSQFQNLTFSPPYVMFSANQTPTGHSKDSAFNARTTGVFCWQLATYALREAVNVTSEQLPFGVDEFERAGLTKVWSRTLPIRVPMVDESPVKFECLYHDTVRLPGDPPMGTVDIVIGKVVGVHINDDVLTDGKLDVRKTLPIARCGYYEYAVVKETFEMMMPGDQIMRDGLEGSSRKNKEYGQHQKQIERKGSPHLVKDGKDDGVDTTIT